MESVPSGTLSFYRERVIGIWIKETTVVGYFTIYFKASYFRILADLAWLDLRFVFFTFPVGQAFSIALAKG